jgi:starch synthase
MRILFAASEAYPYIKTGGLGDVVHSLPIALNALGDDVRLVLPAYRDVLYSMDSFRVISSFTVPGVGVTHQVQVMEAQSEISGEHLYLIDIPALFDRSGNPYVSKDGNGWSDNAERYTTFSRAVAILATQLPELNWKPDVVHCHDWQTGLVPAFMSEMPESPKTVFTIHNLSYDGYFSQHDFRQLHMSDAWWTPDLVEFYGGFSMLKAGLVFADHVTTVSPTYAKEICTPEFGYRYDGILRHLGTKLTGILNGIDKETWNPATDSFIAAKYSLNRNRIPARQKNKTELLKLAGFKGESEPLLGFIGRLVSQKGVDLIIGMLPELLERSAANLVILGSGDKIYEDNLLALANKYPDRLYVHIGYSEPLAHKIEAGCDMFLMPSRFEPCGLNQMYSLRYGTPPVVNHTGGLADTVVGANAETLKNKTANGFVFHVVDVAALLKTTLSAIELYGKPKIWQQICRTAMQIDLGWDASAKEYQKLYTANIEAVA